MSRKTLKRFLVTVRRTETGTNSKGQPATLAHTRHVTVKAATIEAARDLGEEIASRFASHVVSVKRKGTPRKRSNTVTVSRPYWKDHASAQAIQYALWLARRDGIALPDRVVGNVLWSSILRDDDTKESRPYRVTLGTMEAPRELARAVFVPCAEIDLPNWDWQPAPPVETTETNRPLARASWSSNETDIRN